MRFIRARRRLQALELAVLCVAGCGDGGCSSREQTQHAAAAAELEVSATSAAPGENPVPGENPAPGEPAAPGETAAPGDAPPPRETAAPAEGAAPAGDRRARGPRARIRWHGRKPSTCRAPEIASAFSVTYVCDCAAGSVPGCVPGSDTNDGARPAAPLRSLDAASRRFAELAPGGMIALCRGGAFETDGRQWVNPKCRADMPCVVRDYRPTWASADAPRPRIRSTSSVFNLQNGGEAEPEQGYGFYNLELIGGDGRGDGEAFFFYNDVDDVTLCGLRIDGFRIAVHVGGSNPPGRGSDGKNDRIALRDSEIVNNGKQGWLGGCNGCVIENNYFENNGFQHALLDHNIYISGSKDVVRGQRIVNNEIYRSTRIKGRCEGASVVVHGRFEDLLIEGNLVREDLNAAASGCWGIAVDPAYDEPELFRSVVIRGNVIHNVGNIGIGIASCQGCVVENNVIVQEQPIGSCAIAAPNRERAAEDAQLDAIKIRNNSILSRSSQGGCGIKLGGEGGGHELVNNAILHIGGGDFACFDFIDDSPGRFTRVDHNVCFHKQGTWAQGIGTLEKVRARRSIDASSRFADPGFRTVSGAPLDLTPAGRQSPLVDAADPARAPRSDVELKPRDGKPDIGAYELR